MDCSLNLALDLPVGNSKPLPKLFCNFGLMLSSYQSCTNSDPSASQRSPPEASQPQCRAHTKTKSCWEQRAALRNRGFWMAAPMYPITLTFCRTTGVPAKTILKYLHPSRKGKAWNSCTFNFIQCLEGEKMEEKKNHNYLIVHNMHLCTKTTLNRRIFKWPVSLGL